MRGSSSPPNPPTTRRLKWRKKRSEGGILLRMAKRLSTRTSTTKSAVYEHFALSSDGKHYVCQCIQNDGDGEKQCDAKISSFSGHDKNAPTRASNLKRHLHRFHPKVLEAVNEKDSNESIASRSVPKNVQKSTGTQSQIRKFFVSDKVTITMTPEKFKTHIIEMVVKNSLPLSFFSQPAFLGLNGEMAKKLGVSLERENIRKLIIEEAKCKKEELRKVLKGLLPEIPPQEEVQSTCGNSGSSSSNEELDFDSFLDKMEVSKGKRRRISIKEPVDVQIKKYRMEFFKELKEVEKYARSSKLSVEEAILVYPEIISDVARIVTAMPPTQVSVERLFSALKIIKSDLRASMKEDLAEAILFLRTLH